jgi:glycosyltransferase involved in cell wall biosynthesis
MMPEAEFESPKVTWLLAVRNGMPFLRETLASIEKQTYSNWEIIVWDNGSTDGTVEELRQWIPARLPGRVITEQPLKLAEARARLVESATTELCAWIDADDVNVPCRLERQVRFLQIHPEVAVVGSQLQVIDSCGNITTSRTSLPVANDEILRHLLVGPGLAQPSVMFRRSAVLQVGNYRDVGPVHVEDYDLWLRLAVDHSFANIDEPLLQYRVHETSTTVQSEQAGTLQTAVAERFIEHGPVLFGFSSLDARLFAAGRHPCAILMFLGVAARMRRRTGRSLLQTLCSRELLYGASTRVSRADLITRAALAVLRRIPRLEPPRGVA